MAFGLVAVMAVACEERRFWSKKAYVVEVDLAPLIAALGGDDEGEGDEAAERLAAIGLAALPALAVALEREPPRVREGVIGVLASLPPDLAAPVVIRVAQRDEDDDVRGAALRTLGALGTGGALEVVLGAFGDPQPAIRGSAVQACARLCTAPEAVERLAGLAVGDPDLSVALAARAALGALRAQGGRTEAAVRAAIARRRPESLAPDASTEQRVLATLLTVDLEGAAAASGLPALAAAAPLPLKRQIAWLLGEHGDASAVSALRTLLDGADVLLRAYAYDALTKLRARGAEGADEALAAYAGAKPLGPLRPPDP